MGSKISRRQVLTSAGALAVGMPPRAQGEARIGSGGEARSASQRLDALALIGDRYHNSDYIRVALSRLFRDLNLRIDFTINYDRISETLLRPYRLLVILRDGLSWPGGYLEPNDYDYSHFLENAGSWPQEQFVPWITEEQGRAIRGFVEAGGGLYTLHNSSNI